MATAHGHHLSGPAGVATASADENGRHIRSSRPRQARAGAQLLPAATRFEPARHVNARRHIGLTPSLFALRGRLGSPRMPTTPVAAEHPGDTRTDKRIHGPDGRRRRLTTAPGRAMRTRVVERDLRRTFVV
jgi:hypothetical protein